MVKFLSFQMLCIGRLVGSLSIAGLVGLALPTSAAQAQCSSMSAGSNVDVSTRTGNEAEPAIAIDPTNTQRLFAFSNLNSGTSLFGAYSTNGGTTWSTRTMATGSDGLAGACCDPSLSWDSFGNLFICYINSADSQVIVGLSTNGGLSFTQIATMASSGVDQPTITTGPSNTAPNGAVWVCYNQGGTMRVRGASVTGLGTVGAFVAEVAPPSATGSFGDIAVGPSGQVMITYQNPTSGQGPATIYCNTDPDGFGASAFGARVTVTSTNVGGFDVIPAQSARTIDAEAGLAWDRTGGAHNGRVYLVYTDETVNENNDTEIRLRFSDNNGATWSSFLRVNDDTAENLKSQFLPRIAIDQTTGIIAMSWMDCRNSPGNNTAQNWATISTDGGLTVLPNIQIGSGFSNASSAGSSVDYGDYLGLTMHGGLFYPIWSDNSGTLTGYVGSPAFDLATAKVTVTTGPASPTSPLASPATICSGQSSTLSATAGSGETVDWFTGGCGTTAVPGGATPSVSPTSTTTYYARARNTTSGCISSCSCCATVTVVNCSRLFVQQSASGANTGVSWTDAYTTLQGALSYSASHSGITEIWLAAGAYKPAGPGGDRAATIVPPNGVTIYGGFAGTESSTNQRDIIANPTMLSGDLNGDDGSGNYSDNSYHVVTGTGASNSAILDGLVISGGNAPAGSQGGGLVTETGGPTLRNCTFGGSAGACATGLQSTGGSLIFDNLTTQAGIIPGSGTAGLSTSTIQLQGPWSILADRQDLFSTQLSGSGLVNLASAATLQIRNVPACNAEVVTSLGGTIGTTPIFHQNKWAIFGVSLDDFTLIGNHSIWKVNPSFCGCLPGTFTWVDNPLIQDLSAGGLAEATFGGGGTMSMSGKLYDGITPSANLIYDGLLLTATVGPFHVKETTATSNQLAFISPPEIVPTGGFLLTNQIGFRLAGTQVLSFVFSPAQQGGGGPLNNFLSDITLLSTSTPTLSPKVPPTGVTTLQANLTGTGQVIIDGGAQLTVSGGAIVDLSGQSIAASCQQGCPTSDPSSWGRITVNGTLLVSGATIRNTNVDVKLASFQGATSIINNDIRLLESVSAGPNTPSFGGQFFVEGYSTIQCNHIVSDGDRYLDLDPDITVNPRPTICNNKIEVEITQGVNLQQGELLECRGQDFDTDGPNNPAGTSGAYPVPENSQGFTANPNENNNWALETLEVFSGDKVNLTNRQGFEFHGTGVRETTYVKNIILHPNAVLNTGLQPLYYNHLHLVDTDNSVHEYGAGPPYPDPMPFGQSRIVDYPLLGFSLKVIAMEDDTEFSVRVQKRLRDPADVQPVSPPFKEGYINRITQDPDQPPTPIPPGAGGVMDMRTHAVGKQTASSIAAKGAFARAGEDAITVIFKYLFVQNPASQIVVYLSDTSGTSPEEETSDHLVEVARINPPAAGLPGAIGSGQFATFNGRFPRGSLKFFHGTYVELDLVGQDARVWIDDWDPVVCGCPQCGALSDTFACGVTEVDYLYLLSEFGHATSTSNWCADRTNGDGFVDMSDLLDWSAGFHDLNVGNLCGTSAYPGGTPSAVPVPTGKPAIIGKPGTVTRTSDSSDWFYVLNPTSGAVESVLPASSPPNEYGMRSGGGRLISDSIGSLYQVHGALGLIRLSDGVKVLPPQFFTCGLPSGVARVNLGLTDQGGYAISDAAFDPLDSTSTTVYVAPVQVVPTTGTSCPYHAAAKVKLSGGSCRLLAIYGSDPFPPNTNPCRSSCDSCEVTPLPDRSRVLEIEVDRYGNLFALSVQGVNSERYLRVYRPGETTPVIELSGAALPQAPTAMFFDNAHDLLLISTALDGPDTTNTTLARFSITRDANHAVQQVQSAGADIQIQGMRFLTSLAANPADNSVWAVGFDAPTYATLADVPTDGIHATPKLARIANPATATTATATRIDGSDLALPLAVQFATCGVKGDMNGDGLVTTADTSIFVNALLAGPGDATQLCKADLNSDGQANGKDVQGFVSKLLSGG